MGSKKCETTNENATVLQYFFFFCFANYWHHNKLCEMLNWKVAIENALVNGLAASKSEGGHMISVANLLTFDY